MPTETIVFEPQHAYDMTQYLDNLADGDVAALNALAGVVEGEITLGLTRPFADLALDLAHKQPDEVQRMSYRPTPTINDVRLVRADILAVQKLPSGVQESAWSGHRLVDLAMERKLHGLRLRHSLGVQTCQAALEISRQGTTGRVALINTDIKYGFIQPKARILPQIRRQPVDARYRNYVIAHSEARAHNNPNTRARAKHSLLVATAAYAVHQVVGDGVH